MVADLIGLLTYLKGHSNLKRMEIEEIQAVFLADIERDPSLVGIKNPKYVFKEVEFFDDERSGPRTIDIVVIDCSFSLYLVRAKAFITSSVDSTKARYRMNNCLRAASDYFKMHFGVSGNRIGAYRKLGRNDLEHYELKKTPEELEWLARH